MIHSFWCVRPPRRARRRSILGLVLQPLPSGTELRVVLQVLHGGVGLGEIILDRLDERRAVGSLHLHHLLPVVVHVEEGLGPVVVLLEVLNGGGQALQGSEKRRREVRRGRILYRRRAETETHSQELQGDGVVRFPPLLVEHLHGAFAWPAPVAVHLNHCDRNTRRKTAERAT